MSGQFHQRQAHYLGIIIGIVFRIDSTIDKTGRSVGLVSLDMATAAASQGVAAAATIPPPPTQAEGPRSNDASVVSASSGGPSGAEEAVHVAQPGTLESEAKPFPRDGAEPLRAGHPDLWNLLVVGTCLEGSTFRST